MSDKTDSEWQRLWAEAQRQAFTTWAGLGQGAAADPAEATRRMWGEALQGWWQSASPALESDQREVFRKFLTEGRQFLTLGEQVVRMLQDVQRTSREGGDWRALLRGRVDELKAQVASGTVQAPGQQAFGVFLDFPLDMWKRVAATLSGTPGAPSGTGGKDPGQGPDLRAEMERLFGMPAVGFTREWQEQLGRAAASSLEYEKVLGAFQDKLRDITLESLDLLCDRLIAHLDSGKPIDGMRQLYELWVDASEDVYGKAANGEEFARLQANLVNASMAVKRQNQSLTEEWLAAMDIPRRSDMDSALRRLHELRRELRALRSEVAELRAAPAQKARATRAAPSKAKPAAAARKARARKTKPAR